jgi:hypothetical protein
MRQLLNRTPSRPRFRPTIGRGTKTKPTTLKRNPPLSPTMTLGRAGTARITKSTATVMKTPKPAKF